MAANADAPTALAVVWTEPAMAQLDSMPDEPRFNGDKKRWHEEQVRAYAQEHVPTANRARIRKPLHTGGLKADEPEHITVTFKRANKDVGVHHVYAA